MTGCRNCDVADMEDRVINDDYIGKQINYFTVLRRNDIKDKNGVNVIAYECQCECGKIWTVRKSNLRRTKSCGCKKINNYIGKRFGRLVVLEKAKQVISPSNHLITMWHCRCDCGNEVDVRDGNLTSGNVKSCGCLRRDFGSMVNKKYNKYDLTGEYGIGYTYNTNKDGINYFYFDLEDYNIIKDYCWFFVNEGYLTAKVPNTGKHVLLHKLLLPDAEQVDHIKHILYDNRKSQLRPVTRTQNHWNQKKYTTNTSGCTGVVYNKKSESWESRIDVNGKRIQLGIYKKYDDAVNARREAEEKYFGEYSYNNSMNNI